MAIDRFIGKYRFLSNFFPAEVEYEGMVYPSVEYAFQAAKTDVEDERKEIRTAPTPGKAKRLGRKVTLRPDWDKVKESVMEGLVRQKFTRHRPLAAELLETGDSPLIEGNDWGDVTWGMVKKGGEWSGKNLLGTILMKVRNELGRGPAAD